MVGHYSWIRRDDDGEVMVDCQVVMVVRAAAAVLNRSEWSNVRASECPATTNGITVGQILPWVVVLPWLPSDINAFQYSHTGELHK